MIITNEKGPQKPRWEIVAPGSADFGGKRAQARPPSSLERRTEPLHLPSAVAIAVQQHWVAKQGPIEPIENEGAPRVQVVGPARRRATAEEQEQLGGPWGARSCLQDIPHSLPHVGVGRLSGAK